MEVSSDLSAMSRPGQVWPPTDRGELWRCTGLRRCRHPTPPTDFSHRLRTRVQSMLQSHVIDIDGRFVGVALRLDRGFRFIALDPRVEDLAEIIWPGIDDICRMARRALAQVQPPAIDSRHTASWTHSRPAE